MDVHEAETLLLTDGLPDDPPVKLTRRRRLLPVAFDIDDDVAVTLFLRRGVSGDPCLVTTRFHRVDGRWTPLGGSHSEGWAEAYEPRPSISELGRPGQLLSGGKTVRNSERLMPWGAKWVHSVEYRLAREVMTLAVEDRMPVISPHGFATVVWRRPKPPSILAIGADGNELGSLPTAFR